MGNQDRPVEDGQVQADFQLCQIPVSALNSHTSGNTEGDVLSFFVHKTAQGLSFQRLKKIERMFGVLKKMGFQPNTSDNREQVQSMVIAILNREDYSDWTKHDYLRLIKEFYKYHGKSDLINWIKIKVPKPRLLTPTELLYWDDILRLIRFTKHEFLKAFTSVLYDSGCRIGELLNLKYCDIYRDNYGARIYVDGKTGPRFIRLQRSFPILLEYLPYAPREGRIFTGSYNAYSKNIRRLFHHAEIDKPTNFHHFRKSRATELANHLTPSQLCRFFGWIQGSRVLRTYVHTSDKIVDDLIVGLSKE